MQRISDTEAKQEFDSLLDAVQYEPVTIRKQDRDVAVLLSQEDYDRIYGLNVEEFQKACQRLSDKAKAG
jgi:prevent-host-death family protein